MIRTVLLLLMMLSMSACGTLAAGGAGRNNQQYGFDDASATPSDASISANIRRQLISDTAINANEITVSTDQGVVTLEGQVANTAIRDRVLSICNRTTGVRQVVSRLQINQD
ncbi:MAG: BON domain-containing protein [Thiohalophilus sp.]|jgi:osmotically-inducible protein OsmY